MTATDPHATALQQAILAIQAGRLGEAQRLLAALLRQNPENATAWVWLGKAVDDPEKRRECFSRALHLDPENQEARLGMIALLSGPQIAETAPERPKQVSAYPSPCRNCGAHLRYDIATRALRCEHCGTQHPLPEEPQPLLWPGLPPDLSTQEAQGEPIGQETLRCRSCGATTALSVRTLSLACPFCGSPQVIRAGAGTILIPPKGIIPFQVDQAAAERALRDWLRHGWWRPDDLAEKAELLELRGTYLPFWAFKGLGVVSYRMEGSGQASLPQTSGPQQQYVPVQDVLNPASFSLGEATLRQIEPFDLKGVITFHPEYLAGWPAEVYQVALADAAMQAQIRMSQESRTKAEILAPVLAQPPDDVEAELAGWGAHSGRRREVYYRPDFCTVQLDSFLHLMLPVWLGAYRYRGQTFSFAVNAQTGKAGGEAPRSVAITALTAVCGLVLLGLLAALAAYFWPAIRGLLGGIAQTQTVDRGTTFGAGPVVILAALVVFLGLELVVLLPKIRNLLRRRE